MQDVHEIQSKFGIVGRQIEIRRALVAIRAGKHLLIEGPVGVGKTILADAVAKYLGRPFYRVDGDERYTEQKLTGWFDPPLVIKNGYCKGAFMPGPLALAMESGGILFINELNRMPEGVQNVLLPAMDEKKIEVPKIGTIVASNDFVVVSTQNPHEFVATSILSEALRDRFELLTLNYQGEEEEVAIVRTCTGNNDLRLLRPVVRLVRATRTHPDVRRGASIRAAISLSLLASQMDPDRRVSIREAAHMALPTRIELKDDVKRTVYEVIDELLEGNSLENPSIEARRELSAGSFAEPTILRTLDSEGLVCDSAISLLENVADIVDLKKIPSSEIGWSIAQHYMEIKRSLNDQKLLQVAKRIAVRAIIERTLQLLGPTRTRTEQVKEPYSPGQKGDIDVEMTVEEMLDRMPTDASGLIIESKLPRKMACIMMIDASLSMSGDKLGTAAASLGVLAYKLKSIDYGIVVFNSAARVMKQLDHKVAVETLVGDLLDIPAMGLTNIEDALKTGIRELNRAKINDRIGIMITDGHYTAGKDPREVAAQYPRLFIIMINSYDSSLGLCKEMAALGKGKVLIVDTFEEIPQVLRNVLRDLPYRSDGP